MARRFDPRPTHPALRFLALAFIGGIALFTAWMAIALPLLKRGRSVGLLPRLAALLFFGFIAFLMLRMVLSALRGMRARARRDPDAVPMGVRIPFDPLLRWSAGPGLALLGLGALAFQLQTPSRRMLPAAFTALIGLAMWRIQRRGDNHLFLDATGLNLSGPWLRCRIPWTAIARVAATDEVVFLKLRSLDAVEATLPSGPASPEARTRLERWAATSLARRGFHFRIPASVYRLDGVVLGRAIEARAGLPPSL